ncbi:MAG: glycosyltransferase, partial [Chloroflexota bacterium]
QPSEDWIDQFLTNIQFDIVHVTSVHSLGVGALRSVSRSGTPLILTLMDFWFVCPNAQLIRSDGALCDGRTTAWQCQSCLMAQSGFFREIQKIPVPELVQSLYWGSLSKLPSLSSKRGMRGMLLDIDERKQILQEALAIPDHILAHSVFVKEIFELNTANPVTLLEHGIDLAWLKNYHGKTNFNKVRFGYIGQLSRAKGIHVLINAFNQSQLASKAILRIWGDTTRDPAYVRLLDQIRNENQSIELCGRFEQDDLASVLSEIDVLVIPSIWYENSPLVIKEAFAASTPVIATNLGGMAEMVTHNGDGLLFELGDVDDLVIQLRRVIEEPRLLKNLKAGIKPVKSIQQEVVELETVYQSLAVDDKNIVNLPH